MDDSEHELGEFQREYLDFLDDEVRYTYPPLSPHE